MNNPPYQPQPPQQGEYYRRVPRRVPRYGWWKDISLLCSGIAIFLSVVAIVISGIAWGEDGVLDTDHDLKASPIGLNGIRIIGGNMFVPTHAEQKNPTKESKEERTGIYFGNQGSEYVDAGIFVTKNGPGSQSSLSIFANPPSREVNKLVHDPKVMPQNLMNLLPTCARMPAIQVIQIQDTCPHPYVGIAATLPAYTLDVNGTFHAASTALFDSNVVITGSLTAGTITTLNYTLIAANVNLTALGNNLNFSAIASYINLQTVANDINYATLGNLVNGSLVAPYMNASLVASYLNLTLIAGNIDYGKFSGFLNYSYFIFDYNRLSTYISLATLASNINYTALAAQLNQTALKGATGATGAQVGYQILITDVIFIIGSDWSTRSSWTIYQS